MEQIIEYQKTYQEYKAELDGELQRTAEGFVRIGYLLKVARDTNILKESGYTNVTEFAKAEYGIDKTQVSRLINSPRTVIQIIFCQSIRDTDMQS